MLGQMQATVGQTLQSAGTPFQTLTGFSACDPKTEISSINWSGKNVAIATVGVASAGLLVCSLALTTVKLAIFGAIIAAGCSDKRATYLPPLILLGVASMYVTPVTLFGVLAAGGAFLVLRK